MAYQIEFAESVREHFRSLKASERTLVLEAIEEQLLYEPLKETQNRKPLRPNPLAPWELRIGELRVFYEINSDEPQIIRILAIGKKEGNRLFIGGKEIRL